MQFAFRSTAGVQLRRAIHQLVNATIGLTISARKRVGRLNSIRAPARLPLPPLETSLNVRAGG